MVVDFRAFLSALFAVEADPSAPATTVTVAGKAKRDVASLAPGLAGKPSALDWRDQLTPGERGRLPADCSPPDDFTRAALAVRAAFDGEIVEIRWAALEPLTTTPNGYLAPERLPPSWREYFEERAAVREFDGGQTREHAEAEALRETIAAMRKSGAQIFLA